MARLYVRFKVGTGDGVVVSRLAAVPMTGLHIELIRVTLDGLGRVLVGDPGLIVPIRWGPTWALYPLYPGKRRDR